MPAVASLRRAAVSNRSHDAESVKSFFSLTAAFLIAQNVNVGDIMKRSCPYCGHIHEKNYICPDKPKPMKKGSTKITGFRSSKEWQKTRKKILIRDHFLCKICLKNGIFTSGDLQVHHIIPLSEDFTKRTDPDNLITLCPKCHEDAERGDFPAAELVALTGADTPLP